MSIYHDYEMPYREHTSRLMDLDDVESVKITYTKKDGSTESYLIPDAYRLSGEFTSYGGRSIEWKFDGMATQFTRIKTPPTDRVPGVW